MNDLKHNRRELVAESVFYPLKRVYPLAPIKNEEEFLRHYDEFVDSVLIEHVFQGSWERIGWRPIMCFYNNVAIIRGDVDEDFGFRWSPFSLETKKGREYYQTTVESKRNELYHSLRHFKNPIIMFETDRYIIRVDEMDDGGYRYSSWKKENNVAAKPDLILYNGVSRVEGSLHLQYYDFINGKYKYIVSVGSNYGSYMPLITVLKGDQEVLEQNGVVIY